MAAIFVVALAIPEAWGDAVLACLVTAETARFAAGRTQLRLGGE